MILPSFDKGLAVEEGARRVDIEKENFNRAVTTRRRLTRTLMAQCFSVKEVTSMQGPIGLIKIIRDAIIAYYEAYKVGGFIHGGKFSSNP